MNGVQEFFSIVPWTIIFQYCNLLILCLLIKKFLFKPVMNVLNQRQAEIDGIYDAANEDRARAAALSMVPTTTGAAKAVALIIPALKGKMNGMALRVPTPDVSIVDLTFMPKKEVTAEEVNDVVRKAAAGDMGKYLGVVDDECVSMDFVHDDRSSIFAPDQTIVMNGLVKVFAWYDNEWGYSCRCVDLTNYVIEKGL